MKGWGEGDHIQSLATPRLCQVTCRQSEWAVLAAKRLAHMGRRCQSCTTQATTVHLLQIQPEAFHLELASVPNNKSTVTSHLPPDNSTEPAEKWRAPYGGPPLALLQTQAVMSVRPTSLFSSPGSDSLIHLNAVIPAVTLNFRVTSCDVERDLPYTVYVRLVYFPVEGGLDGVLFRRKIQGNCPQWPACFQPFGSATKVTYTLHLNLVESKSRNLTLRDAPIWKLLPITHNSVFGSW